MGELEGESEGAADDAATAVKEPRDVELRESDIAESMNECKISELQRISCRGKRQRIAV